MERRALAGTGQRRRKSVVYLPPGFGFFVVLLAAQALCIYALLARSTARASQMASCCERNRSHFQIHVEMNVSLVCHVDDGHLQHCLPLACTPWTPSASHLRFGQNLRVLRGTQERRVRLTAVALVSGSRCNRADERLLQSRFLSHGLGAAGVAGSWFDGHGILHVMHTWATRGDRRRAGTVCVTLFRGCTMERWRAECRRSVSCLERLWRSSGECRDGPSSTEAWKLQHDHSQAPTVFRCLS
jgi:hypothetical protein